MKNKIIVRKVDETNIKDVDQCDAEFSIKSQLILQAKNNQISYTITDYPPTKKRYQQDKLDYTNYINNPEKAIFLTYIDMQIVGQIVLCKYWNNYAYIENIGVDSAFRRCGIGLTLIEQAKQWAQTRQLAGIMLETQNNNVQACLFYEQCGFKIGGFDNNLYKGLNPDTDEVAIFWYFHF